jgi:hypothetical protein
MKLNVIRDALDGAAWTRGDGGEAGGLARHVSGPFTRNEGLLTQHRPLRAAGQARW